MDLNDLAARSKIFNITLHEIASCDEVKSDTESEECCVICLDRVAEQAQANPCKHKSFDYLCLLSWLEQQTTCPLCKSEVVSVYYDSTANDQYKVYNVIKPSIAKLSGPRTQRPHTYSGRRIVPNIRRPYIPRAVQSPSEAILVRQHVYRNRLFSLHVGSNRLSRFRDLTPHLFSSDTELVSRARKWIRRELQVFEFLSPNTSYSPGLNTSRQANNAEFLLEYIIAILKTVDTQGSGGQAEEMLQEFLGRENTILFLHELRAWLRSPYVSLDDWDRAVQYAEPKKGLNGTTSQEQKPRGSSVDRGRPETSLRYKPYHVNKQEAQKQARQKHTPD